MVLQVLRSYSPQFLDNFFGEKEVTNPASPKRKVFFQEKTSSIKSITPYEGAAFSNIPAATNLFLLIPDCYSTYNALKNANKLYDMEAKSDAITRIAGFVPNFISSVGTNISYGEVLHIIPKKEVPTLFGKIFPIFGILLCIVEAVVECVSLKRQLNFLGSLHINFFDTKKKSEDPSKSPIENLYAAIKSMLDGSENFYEVLGPIKSHKHKKSLEALLVSLKNTPTIKDKHMREAKRILLHRNLTFLRAKYLELNESEMTRIAARVHSKFKDQISDKAFIEEKVQAAYSHKLIAKK